MKSTQALVLDLPSVGGINISPQYSAEKLSNWDFSSWASTTDANNWFEQAAGGNTVEQDAVIYHSSPYSLRCTIVANGSNGRAFYNGISGVNANDWVLVDLWVYGSVAGKTVACLGSAMGQLDAPVYTLTGGVWDNIVLSSRVASSSPQFFPDKVSAQDSFICWDDISVKVITFKTMFANPIAGSNNSHVTARWKINKRGVHAGVAACVDSPTAPANLLLAYIDGDTASGSCNIKLDKYVAGTPTNLINSNVQYVPYAPIDILKNGTSVTLSYNGSQVGTPQTVSDAGIISNNTHYLFSAHESSECDGLSIVAA